MNYDEMLRLEQSKKTRKKQTYGESNLQQKCVKWFDSEYPEKKMLMHHSPNEGIRTAFQGGIAKSMGMRRGFPDLILLVPRVFRTSWDELEVYGYLAIEMKEGKGSQTKEQKEYEKLMNESGGCYVVVKDLKTFQDVVKAYLELNDMSPWMRK